MKQVSTLFLKGAIGLIGIVVLVISLLILSVLFRSDHIGGYWPILLGMVVTAVPFFIALLKTLKLLGYIDAKKAFSELSVNTLNTIKYCALTIGGLYALAMPYIYIVADEDDAPGVIVIGLFFAFTAFVIATFIAVLQRILQEAIEIKSENDLTV